MFVGFTITLAELNHHCLHQYTQGTLLNQCFDVATFSERQTNTYFTASLTTNKHPFNDIFSRSNWVSQYWKSKTFSILMKPKMREFWDGSAIGWIICKQSAPCSRQITTHYQLIFMGQMLFLTSSQHCQGNEGT